MTTFKYKTENRMEPRPGANYATVYKQPVLAEKKRMQIWVEDACKQAEYLAKELDVWEEFKADLLPNKKHRHLNGPRYTRWEAMTDLRDQLRSGKDVPDAMVDRWNNAFEDNSDMQIEWEVDRPAGNNFGGLFTQ
jgi:hypothetical protein